MLKTKNINTNRNSHQITHVCGKVFGLHLNVDRAVTVFKSVVCLFQRAGLNSNWI